jgi:hypothetical protein
MLTAASTYEAQFTGAFSQFRTSPIWQAKTEPKCRFFTWLPVLGKSSTLDNLMKKNWRCDPCSPLCYCEPETNNHILTKCNFAAAVWDKVALDFQVHLEIKPFLKGNTLGWITAATKTGSRQQ